MKFIAEVKTQSPYGYKSDKNWFELFNLANQIGDIISIHTNPRWGGSFEDLKIARSLTDKPILAKGFHYSKKDVDKCINNGANHVLFVVKLPQQIYNQYELKLFFYEPLTIHQLRGSTDVGVVIWNQRDLLTGKPKKEDFDEVRKIYVKRNLCQASLLKSWLDVDMSADAILVGEHLENFK